MTFKQSPVIFTEEGHTYLLGDRPLTGITGLIHDVLGLGVYPEASDYAKDYLIPRAGSRGTAVHHAIQTLDQLGVRQTVQVVKTIYGSHTGNIREVNETWDVSYELDCYQRHLKGFLPLANELTVSDNCKYASQIDNVWLREMTKGIWLVDTKTNNTALYPTCGYFKPGYFRNGEEALKEYLSWQLSLYAYLFERENPGMKVEGLACNWLRKDDSAFWVIGRKEERLVESLLSTEYVFTGNRPVFFHPDPSIIGIDDHPAKGPEVPQVPTDVVNYVADLLAKEKELKRQIEDAKAGLRAAMEKYGVRSCDLGAFRATIAADSVRATFDTARFRKDHPGLYQEYITRKTAKGGLTIRLKAND